MTLSVLVVSHVFQSEAMLIRMRLFSVGKRQESTTACAKIRIFARSSSNICEVESGSVGCGIPVQQPTLFVLAMTWVSAGRLNIGHLGFASEVVLFVTCDDWWRLCRASKI